MDDPSKNNCMRVEGVLPGGTKRKSPGKEKENIDRTRKGGGGKGADLDKGGGGREGTRERQEC